MAKNKGLRTCIVTGKKSASADFFRFTIQNGVFTFDGKKKNNGRGGYVEKNKESVLKIKKIRGKISHFLKTKDIKIPDDILEKVKI